MALLFLKRTNKRESDGFFSSRTDRSYRPPINFLPIFLILVLLAVAWELTFGYQDEAITIEDIEQSLTPEELAAFQAEQQEVDEKFEDCIQYILYALEDGLYQCTSCPAGIPFVTLKKGEVWYIGHTCQDDDARHSQSFRAKHHVGMFTNYIGSKEVCHKIELKLIRAYKYLPESLKPEVKLILPPHNLTDKN